MSNNENIKMWADIMRTIAQTNILTKEILKKDVPLYKMPLEVLQPNWEIHILAFTQSVSYAYMLLCDGDNKLSKKNLEYFRSFVPTLQTDLTVINDLRTHFQHYVSIPKEGAKNWFMQNLDNAKNPITNNHYEACVIVFLNHLKKIVTSIYTEIKEKNNQLENQSFIESWSAIHNENVPDEIDFHAIFREVRVIFGLPHLDTSRFVNPNKVGWENGLKNFKGGDVKEAVISLIVKTLVQQIKDKSLPIPLKPGEVMAKYGIQGKVIGEYHLEAYRIYLDCEQDQAHTLILETVWQKMDDFHQNRIQ